MMPRESNGNSEHEARKRARRMATEPLREDEEVVGRGYLHSFDIVCNTRKNTIRVLATMDDEKIQQLMECLVTLNVDLRGKFPICNAETELHVVTGDVKENENMRDALQFFIQARMQGDGRIRWIPHLKQS